MVGWVLGLAVAVSAVQDAQAPSPVFRTQVDVVAFEITVGRILPFGIRRPYRDLTVDDVTVVLEKNTYVPVKLTQDPKKAGRYLVSFTPADEYRDGQDHAIEVIVKMGSRRPITMPMTIMIARPTDVNAATSESSNSK
jgi:hypothetical protein